MAEDGNSTPSDTSGMRQPSLLDALIPCIALICLLALSYMLFGDGASSGPNQVALMFCGLIAAGVAYKNGMSWTGLREAAVEGIATGLPAMLILLAVGALIGAWALSGTIMAMVYYGLKLLSPHYFYATTAVVCAVVAFGIGSSWTVAGTIGIGLMGVAFHMGLSPAITAGAIISGAYFGDKASPLSDTVNLAAAVAGSDIYAHIRESLWTSVPALAVAVTIFAILGEPGDFDASSLLGAIESKINVSVWAFLPLVLVFGLSMARVAPFVAIFAGALAGGLLAVLQDPARVVEFAAAPDLAPGLALIKGVWSVLANGYNITTGDKSVDVILSRGGMSSMMNTVWLIISALAFGAIVEHAGLLNRLIDPLVSRTRSKPGIVTTVAGTAVLANVVTADQYISIALPGRIFRKAFAEKGLAPVMLSRVIGDSATVTSPLIPWNSCGAYMASALGVGTVAYAGFCFFNLLNPIFTILFTVLGWRVLTIPQATSPGGDNKPSSHLHVVK